MIEYTHKVKVYYRDIDQMGIVYYTRYLEYFEEARTELLRSIGLGVTDMEKDGYYLPVISVNCKYEHPARFDNVLQILTKMTEVPRSILKIEYTIKNSEDKICVKGETLHTFTNTKGKAVKPPKNVIETIKRNIE